MVSTDRSIVITEEAREPSQYLVVKNHDEYHFEFVNFFTIMAFLNQMNEQ